MPRRPLLTILLLASSLPSALSQTVIGVYPSYPPAGPLLQKSPAEQAAYLRSLGVTLAGGTFDDDAVPDALRQAGMRTMGLVVLFQGEQHWKQHPESRPIMSDVITVPSGRYSRRR